MIQTKKSFKRRLSPFALCLYSFLPLFLLFLPQLSQQAWSAENSFKLGAVDSQRVFDEYEAAQGAMKTLENLVEELRKKGEKLDQERDELEKKLAKQRAFLEDESKEKEMIGQINQKTKELRDFVEAGQNRISEKRKELADPLLAEIEALIQKIGAEEGFSIIFEKRLVTIYVDPKFDLTTRVIEILNKDYRNRRQSQSKTKGEEKTVKEKESKESQPQPSTQK